ncbi:MAG: phosphomannomutase/phosphoglucomutase [Alphaproteobacteria bacterium]|nr:phosphomannomutase/phosphoglucomutase [Alphaproteobacteria bacterium]
MRHTFDPTVLREYDIRGRVGETLSAADARAVGQSFGTMVRDAGGRRVSVGRDGRHSSPELSAALVEGLTAVGIDVIDIGRVSTPTLYFSVFELGTDGGVMITGSHNPPAYNGFKMMLGRKAFYGEAIQRLGRIAADGRHREGQGTIEERNIRDIYADRVVRDLKLDRQLTIVWDTGNGAAGPSVNDVSMRLESRHFLLNVEVDGDFPNHHPDPTVAENLVDLIAKVKETGADLGIGFDGDGDRIGVVDNLGRILWGDQLLAIFAEDVLKRHRGAPIIADVKASKGLYDWIAEKGGKPVMWKSGHSLVKAKMAEMQAPLAGEMSGHIFFGDGWYGFDDALFAGVRLIQILANGKATLAELKDRLPQAVNTPELRFSCPEERKFKVVEEVKAWLRGRNDGRSIVDIDGVRVTTPDGWWLLRASNTQAALTARCESADESGLDRLKDDLRAALASAGVALVESTSAAH